MVFGTSTVIACGFLAAIGISRMPVERIGSRLPESSTVPSTANSPLQSRPPANKTLDIPGKCKALISNLMGRPVDIMASQYPSGGDTNMAFVSYMRNDGTTWKYQCKTDGSTIVWRGVDIDGPGSGPGRWRNEDRVPLSSLQSGSVEPVETWDSRPDPYKKLVVK